MWAQGDTEADCYVKFTTRVINAIDRQIPRREHDVGSEERNQVLLAMSRSIPIVLKC